MSTFTRTLNVATLFVFLSENTPVEQKQDKKHENDSLDAADRFLSGKRHCAKRDKCTQKYLFNKLVFRTSGLLN